VSAESSSDVWAVGEVYEPDSRRVLIEHWDGSSWTRVCCAWHGIPTGISAVSPTDAWISGLWGQLRHWDGTSWTRVPPVNRGAVQLLAVSARTATDVWTVGARPRNGKPPVIDRWNGTTWTVF
jgi:hypothetical protein